MKGRLSSTALPDQFRKDFELLIRSYETRYRNAVIERFTAGMLLMLNDVYGFGEKRLKRALKAFMEIVYGYNDEAYEGVEKRFQHMEDMNVLMRQELESRGILISQNHGNIIINMKEKKGKKNDTDKVRRSSSENNG